MMNLDDDYRNPFDSEYRPDPPYDDEEYDRIREACGMLLSQWCVVRNKDKQSKSIWELIANTRYRPQIEKNLSNVNMELTVIDASMREVAYIHSENSGGHARFSKAESIVLLRSYQLLQQSRARVALSSTPAGHSVDIQDLMSACNVGVSSKNAIDLKTMKTILYKLEQYNLLRVEEKYKKDFNEFTAVTILPSVSYLLQNPPLDEVDRILKAYIQEGKKDGSGGGNDTEDLLNDDAVYRVPDETENVQREFDEDA